MVTAVVAATKSEVPRCSTGKLGSPNSLASTAPDETTVDGVAHVAEAGADVLMEEAPVPPTSPATGEEVPLEPCTQNNDQGPGLPARGSPERLPKDPERQRDGGEQVKRKHQEILERGSDSSAKGADQKKKSDASVKDFHKKLVKKLEGVKEDRLKKKTIPRIKHSDLYVLTVRPVVEGRSIPAWQVDVKNMRLKDLIRKWASDVVHWPHHQLPDGVRPFGASVSSSSQAGGSKSSTSLPPLSLEDHLKDVKKQLPVKEGRIQLAFSWPVEAIPKDCDKVKVAYGAHKEAAAARVNKGPAYENTGLGRLRRAYVSTRYAEVDRNLMKRFCSRTEAEKRKAGTFGSDESRALLVTFPPAIRAGAQVDPEDSVWQGDIDRRTFIVFGDDFFKQVLFTVDLVGPATAVANWMASVERYEHCRAESGDKFWPDENVPFPVFIPSRGRPEKAHLNWEAPHVFGPPAPAGQPGDWPVVVIVVEPEEEEDYRRIWTNSLLLVLPKANMGPGYVRWVVQKFCLRAYEENEKYVEEESSEEEPPELETFGGEVECEDIIMPKSKSGEPKYFVRRTPLVWLCDDTLVNFARLVGTATQRPEGFGAKAMAQKTKELEAGPMFLEGMLAVQRHQLMPNSAIGGFLRDDGTAICKKKDWVCDELSIYKILLLNLTELHRINVEYVPGLRKFEDVGFNNEILSRHGRTLKCMCYCFRAVHLKSGGCAPQRKYAPKSKEDLAEEAKLCGIISLEDFRKLPPQRKAAVLDLVKWQKHQETYASEKRRTMDA